MISASMRSLSNRHVSPGQIKILQTLWSSRLRRARQRLRPERSREARLQLISEIVGHPVSTSKELSWREANRVIRQWLEEMGPRPGLETEAAVETATAAAGEPRSVETVPDAPSREQLWKIRQIAQYLGWSGPGKTEVRLPRFLKAKFHVEVPEQLTHDQAWRAIEALCAAGARARIKARKGKSHVVRREELTREVTRLKGELEVWRPA